MGQLLTCLGTALGDSIANNLETIPNDIAGLLSAPTIPPAELSQTCKLILYSTLAGLIAMIIALCATCCWCYCGGRCKRRKKNEDGSVTTTNNYIFLGQEMTQPLLSLNADPPPGDNSLMDEFISS
jgi:hypothetical protein